MWKNLFGTAAIIFASGFFIRSLQPAHAQFGPSISLGSNPIEHVHSNCNGNGIAMFSNNTSADFIIIDFVPRSGTYTLSINGNTALISGFNDPTTLGAGIKVRSGETLTCQNNYNYPLTIAGYYMHP